MKKSVALWIVTLVVLGCGGGGTVPAATFDGGWWLSRTDDDACGDIPDLGVPLSFSQTGSTVTMTTPDETLTGSVTDSTAAFGGQLLLFDTAGGHYVIYSGILLTRIGDVITGSATVRTSASLSGTPADCESAARLKAVPEMRLIDFNLDMVAEAPANLPLVFTFTQDVDPTTITPDTVHVTGLLGPFFDSSPADGRSFALIPHVPSFDDYSDLGLHPGITYDVVLTDYMDPSSIRSTLGAPLMPSGASMFTVRGNTVFVEPRRPLVHTPGPSSSPPGRGDEDGCLDNADNSLYSAPGFQTGTDASATLLCLVNEGPPHVVPEACVPVHDARDVGLDGAMPAPYLLPAIQIRINEPVRPDDVARWDTVTKLGFNVQLWRVGDADANPIPLSASNQVATNAPLTVQDTESTKVILVALAPQPSGTYLVNVRGLVDLPGNALVTTDRPDPSVGGYAAIDATLAGVVPDGYRYYFRTP